MTTATAFDRPRRGGAAAPRSSRGLGARASTQARKRGKPAPPRPPRLRVWAARGPRVSASQASTSAATRWCQHGADYVGLAARIAPSGRGSRPAAANTQRHVDGKTQRQSINPLSRPPSTQHRCATVPRPPPSTSRARARARPSGRCGSDQGDARPARTNAAPRPWTTGRPHHGPAGASRRPRRDREQHQPPMKTRRRPPRRPAPGGDQAATEDHRVGVITPRARWGEPEVGCMAGRRWRRSLRRGRRTNWHAGQGDDHVTELPRGVPQTANKEKVTLAWPPAASMRLAGGHPALTVHTVFGPPTGPVEPTSPAPETGDLRPPLGLADQTTPASPAPSSALRLRDALDAVLRARSPVRTARRAAGRGGGRRARRVDAAHLGPHRDEPWPGPGRRRPQTPVHRLAHAAIELLTSEADLAVVHCCAGCRWLFLDHSRGPGRRWCSMADCGTEAKKRRYVQRRRERRAASGG